MPPPIPNDATIVRTIIDMGTAASEWRSWPKASRTKNSSRSCAARGCHFAQGRLFGDAMSAEEFLALLLAQQAGSSNIVRLFA